IPARLSVGRSIAGFAPRARPRSAATVRVWPFLAHRPTGPAAAPAPAPPPSVPRARVTASRLSTDGSFRGPGSEGTRYFFAHAAVRPRASPIPIDARLAFHGAVDAGSRSPVRPAFFPLRAEPSWLFV